MQFQWRKNHIRAGRIRPNGRFHLTRRRAICYKGGCRIPWILGLRAEEVFAELYGSALVVDSSQSALKGKEVASSRKELLMQGRAEHDRFEVFIKHPFFSKED
jgi:hypothetical protein